MRDSRLLTTVAQRGSAVRAWWIGAALACLLAGRPSVALAGPVVVPRTAGALQVAAPTPADPETSAITELLREYRDAFAALDVDRVVLIWPGVDRKALAQAFGRLEQQFFVFERCAIAVDAERADARCSGNARVVPRVGGRSAQYRNGEWHFTVRRNGDRWQIQAVEATTRPSVR